MKREERFALFSFFENLIEIGTIYGHFPRLTELVALLKFLYSFLRSQNASFFSNEVLHFLVTYGKKAIEF